MASKKKMASNISKVVDKEKSTIKTPPVNRDFLDGLDSFFQKRLNFFFWFGLTFTALFSIFLFDVKVGPGGDDSAYILRAFDFVHEFRYPSYQGPLYPIVLSPFIAIFGINLPILKFLSTIFTIIAAAYFFKAFKNLIPASILVFVFFLTSFNYYLLYFASQTYNEAFFMMLQAIFFYYAAKYFISGSTFPTKKQFIVIGLLLFLMCLTKNIAFVSLIALLGFFILTRKWKNILYTIGSFALFFVPWELIKRFIWKTDVSQISSQGSMLMYKDFYNPTRGKEDFMGFLQRIIDNSNLYLSKHFYKFIGFRPDSVTEILPILTVITVILFLVGVFWAFRKNKLLFLTGIYLASMLLVSFVMLQKHWDQWRLIIIFYPFMLLFLFSALYYSFKTKELKSFQFIIPLFTIIIFFASFSTTSSNVKTQREALSQNLDGNNLYGWTPDWQSFIQMSQWAAKNTPPQYAIASRKPDISFIYTQRKFYGIAKVPTSEIDSIILKNKPDSIVYTIFHIKKLTETNQRGDLKYRAYLQGVISGSFAFGSAEVDESNYIGIYALPKNILTEMRNDPLIKGIAAEEPDALGWVNKMKKENTDIAIFKPDYIYQLLKKANVKYALLASLRLNPNQYTGSIITTIHRYMYFIQLKYPDAFKEIHKIGTDEPCTLVEIKLD